MSDIKLVKTRLHAGVWQGELLAPEGIDTPPILAVTLHGQAVGGLELTQKSDDTTTWHVSFPIRAKLLNDGVQAFVLSNVDTGEKLGHFSVIAGEALAENIRAEVDLLRAELDLLKRSFRRHCVEVADR